MKYVFKSAETQKEYGKFLDIVIPRLEKIMAFCDSPTEDNMNAMKKRLLEYESHNNFLSYRYSDAMTFYKLALALEWDKEPDFKGTMERKARSEVEARAIEPEAVLERFERLIKGLATSLTAIQTALQVEKALLLTRPE